MNVIFNRAIALGLGICVSISLLFGQTNTWTSLGDGLNWEDAGNWSLGVPLPAHDVLISGVFTVQINCNHLYLIE